MADVSQLPWTIFGDIVNNYATKDARSPWVSVARVLDRTTPLLRVLPMIPSNQIMSNIATRTDSLPVASTRRWNEFALPTAAKNTPLNDGIMNLEDYSEVDKQLCAIQNDPTAWRMDQDANHIEGIRQKAESTFWYGSLAQNPGAINGLATRFNNLESYPNGDLTWQPNVLSNGASTGPVTSIWVIEFGPQKVYGIYPPNMPGGLMVEDLGEITKQGSTSTSAPGPSQNGYMQMYLTHLHWMFGLQIADERCVQRIANVNPTILSSPGNFDENVLIDAINFLPGRGDAPGTVIFVNRAISAQIDIRSVSQKLNAYYTQDPTDGNVWGRRVTRFQGIPILLAEKIVNTETIVS
jgi:hypothetical protein